MWTGKKESPPESGSVQLPEVPVHLPLAVQETIWKQ